MDGQKSETSSSRITKSHNPCLLLRAVFLCSGAPQPEHGFQDSGLRGHPRFTSWGRALLQVSRDAVRWNGGMGYQKEDPHLRVSLCSPGSLSLLKLILGSARPQEGAGR